MCLLKIPGGLARPATAGRRLLLLAMFVLLAGLSGQAQALLPESSYKYRVTRQVFDRLAFVFANSRPEPRLEIIARHPHKPRTIALYKPGNQPLIQLDEEVYDLCGQLGADSLDALAVLLSHELAHHYEKHDWYYTFGIGQGQGPASQEPASRESIGRFESEADFYGCFYGELAGFASGRVFPRILDLVYQRYQLAARLAGYPGLEERKAIYAKKQTEASQLVAVFKAGKSLYLLQEFDAAAQCFEYLVNRFPSREILNNLSAAKLQQALALATSQQQPGFVYPVELDGRSRLIALQRSAPGAAGAKPLPRLLAEARKYAEKARDIDPDYVPAYVNLACVYALQGNPAAAVGVINELGPARLSTNARTIRAIAYYQDQQPDKARQDFEAAQRQSGYMAAYNLALFNNLNQTFTGSLVAWISEWFSDQAPAAARARPVRGQREKISGKAAPAALPRGASQLKVGEKPYLAITWVRFKDHLQLSIQGGSRNYQVLFTGDRYPLATARKIRQGSHHSALTQQYGAPTFTCPTARGEYWVYQPYKMAFEIDRQGRVSNWLLYARTL